MDEIKIKITKEKEKNGAHAANESKDIDSLQFEKRSASEEMRVI
jgi:hypothetical protein